jgi:hypothetical protein
MHINTSLDDAFNRASTRRDTPKLNALRDCFEGAMDFDTALGCAGLSDLPDVTIDALRRLWDKWEARFENGEGA